MLLLLIALLLVGGGADDAAQPKPKPRPIPIVEPGALAIDYQGGLAVADRKLNRVVRIDLRTGARRVLVAGLREIDAVTYDDQFRLYVGSANRIYRIDGRRKVRLAGTATRAYTGDGGAATAASLGGLGGFDVDHDETIVLSEYDNRIRFIGPDRKISTIAGTGEEGYAGDSGPATKALLQHPHDIATRADREVVIADSQNGVLRRIDPAGVITTLAKGFRAPVAVQGGAGNSLFVADAGANAIYKLTPDGSSRRVVGKATAPAYLAVDENDTLYVSELAGARRVLLIPHAGRTRVLVT
jgi:hypothetical protein